MGPSKTIARLRAVRDAVGRTGEDGESPEAGFTLIELMVVLLIMGILLAIAIPTFLGVTGSAHAAAAKTNLSSAMIEAQSSYTSTSSFAYPVATEVKALTGVTKAMKFTASGSKGTTNISVDVFAATGGAATATTSQIVVMATLSKTKVCWMEADNESSTTPATGGQVVTPGVRYYGFKTATTATCIASKLVPAGKAKTGTVAAVTGWANKFPKVT